jgi:hypothetical protein
MRKIESQQFLLMPNDAGAAGGSNGTDLMKDIPVFLPNSSSPAFRITRDEARELVDYGRAQWRKHGRAIRLFRAFDERDFSSLFKPDAALTASMERRAAIDAWASCGSGGGE